MGIQREDERPLTSTSKWHRDTLVQLMQTLVIICRLFAWKFAFQHSDSTFRADVRQSSMNAPI